MRSARWKTRVAAWGAAAAAILSLQVDGALGVSLHDGLITYWRLNEASGAVANDTGPAGSVADNAMLRNGPSWISGKFNSGLQFDGLSQDALVAASSDMDINANGVTISAWVKLDMLPSAIATSFAGIYDSGPDNYVMYLDRANNELRFKATNANGVSTLTAQHPGIRASMLNTTDWIHVMGVYDGDAGRSKIYFNGQLIDVTSHTGSGNLLEGPVRTGQIASIGGQPAATDPFAAGSFFPGAVSDLAVWNRALGGAEAQYLYNGGAGNAVGAANPNINPLPPLAPVLPTAQPVVYYKFDDNLTNYGTGGNTLDAVVNGPNPSAFTPTSFGNGLDLTGNPISTNSSTGLGNYLSVGYTLPDNGTIAARVTPVELANYITAWSNSSHGNDWESWIYGDGRFAARAHRDTQILAHNVFMLDDPSASTHYAFTWERTGDQLLVRLYVNGEFVDERLGNWQNPGSTFFIGGGVADDGATENHYGKAIYDEFRIYSSALSEAEVLYLSQNAPEVVAPSFDGDFNSDGMVNGTDLGLWKVGFGKSTGALRNDGDADHDGDVDGADLLVWQREYGSGTATGAAGAVPEPASGLLAALAMGLAMAARRRR